MDEDERDVPAGGTPLERIGYDLQLVEEELTAARRALDAARDPETVYRRVIEMMGTVVDKSYLTFGPDRRIRYVDPVALGLMGRLEEPVVGRDYDQFVRENPLPSEAGVIAPPRATVLMLDNKNVISLGPGAIIRSTVPDDRREYGGIVRVSEGPDVAFVTRVKAVIGRQSRLLDKVIAERIANRRREG